MNLQKKAINFDLDTVKMREINLYPKGYKDLKKAFKKEGFIHRQGSGYISRNKLSNDAVRRIVRNITNANPWLAECVKKIDVTDIGRQHDLTAIVRDYQTRVAQRKEVEPIKPKHKNIDAEPKNRRDEELKQRIQRSPRGAEFNRLYNGHERGAAAEIKLMNLLAFFTNSDSEQMARLYCSSALYDSKKGITYVQELGKRAVTTMSQKQSHSKAIGKDNGRQFDGACR